LADIGADVENEADLKFVDQLSNIHILGDAIDQFWRGKLVQCPGIRDDHFPKQAKPSCALAPQGRALNGIIILTFVNCDGNLDRRSCRQHDMTNSDSDM
jgi:hypothetical protein